MTDKQKETEKFVGCILSVKTKPGQYGDVQHIIGTVREIDVSSSEQAIVLDQAMSNGAMLPDGYVLLSGQIADLQVMGKASEIQANLKSAYSRSNTVKPNGSPNVIREVNDFPVNNSVPKSGVQITPMNHVGLGYVNGSESLNKNLNGNHVNNGSMALMNSITTAMADFTVRSNQSEKDNGDLGGHMIAKPKPRKPVDGATNISSPQQKALPQLNKTGIHSAISNNGEVSTVKSNSTSIGLSTKSNSNSDGNILMRTFGNLSTANTGASLNGQALFNTVTNPGKSSTVPVVNMKQTNNIASPSKLMSLKPQVYDHKKLGVLSKFVNNVESSEENQPQLATPKTPKNRIMNNTQSDTRLTRSQGKGNGRQQQQQQLRHGETFESMSKDEMTQDFDFDYSNAQFAKLPVTSTKPTKVTKTPQFCSTDTTYLAERVVESITVKDAVTSIKHFVTDTGVAIPSVDLPTRSKILNLAHGAGLTHSRVVEVMGRAVAQAVIPLLGDSYRLSPERSDEDRPWILVCAGPHWQGAIGIAAARILASLGVHTCVHAPKEELQLCATEEFLYNMSGELLTRQIKDLQGYQFELVIMAVDDHLSRSLTLVPYSRWLKNVPVLFVDPPLISSYRQQLDGVCGGNQKGRKIVIVSPVLPIAYPSDSTVKIFLVNLGIPNVIFAQNDVVYKSPFGDKLVIQIFNSSPK